MAITIPSFFSRWPSQGAVYGFKEKMTYFWDKQNVSASCDSLPAIYCNDFFLEGKTPWTHYRQSQSVIVDSSNKKAFSSLDWQVPNKTLFAKHFALAQEKLKSDRLKKIVLTTETRALKAVAPDVFLNFTTLAIPPQTYCYGQWDCDQGFIGYSPEILFAMEEQGVLKTMALAGTSALPLNSEELFSFKNIEEHRFVVEDIVSTLKPFGEVECGEMNSLSLQSLAHLATPIRVVLHKNQRVEDIVVALHPTPALGVSPRASWKDLKEMRSGYGSFGAPFVVVDDVHPAVALVSIRNITWDKDYYYIRSGCGVVKESQLEEEWEELLLKIQSVKKMFGLVEL